MLVGQGWSAKLCDFGFSRSLDNVETRGRDRRMRKMTVAGTDQWMAPEVLMQQKYNEAADIFSLGCTFYEVMCLRQPPTRVVANHYAFDVQDFLQDVEKNTPKELVMLVLDMCQLQPHRRPSAKQVLTRLSKLADALPVADLTEGLSYVESRTSLEPPRPPGVDDEDEGDGSSRSSDARDELQEQSHRLSKETDANLLSLQLRRALSADASMSTTKDSSASSGGVSKSNSRVTPLASHVRYERAPLRDTQPRALVAGQVVVHSSAWTRSKKSHAVLVSEGTLFFYKNDKSDVAVNASRIYKLRLK